MKVRVRRNDGKKTEWSPAVLRAYAAAVSFGSAVNRFNDIKARALKGRTEWEEGEELVRDDPILASKDVLLDSVEGLGEATLQPSGLAITPVRPNQSRQIAKLRVPLHHVLPEEAKIPLPFSGRHLRVQEIPRDITIRTAIGMSPTGARLSFQTRRQLEDPNDDPDNKR